MDLTDEQWTAIRPSIPGPEKKGTTKEGGRPWRDPRDVLNGVLWVLRTGAPWADLPARYPPYQTCHRRFQRWIELGVFEKILRALAEHLRRQDYAAFENSAARQAGFRPLAQSGLDFAVQGVTSINEVIRVSGNLEDLPSYVRSAAAA